MLVPNFGAKCQRCKEPAGDVMQSNRYTCNSCGAVIELCRMCSIDSRCHICGKGILKSEYDRVNAKYGEGKVMF